MASFNGGSAAGGGGGGGGQDGPHNKRLCTGQEMSEVPLNNRVSVDGTSRTILRVFPASLFGGLL
ncbi:hypothetical protein ZHAS_00018277 [Anopheles sinensis]|uniref:Uncharacterized protein n=1 Tax=Anopheles sinensis TaxID=74873 RepID=A0A084WJ15_ANOSI|nr:hypothetical protein ZHAS_00018277 [Anopheles sinensis]